MDSPVWESYWRQFVDVKIAEEYYLLYIQSSRRWMTLINVFCFLTSCAAVVSWMSSYMKPLVSSVIILLSQIISALQPFYPFTDRLHAADCIYKDLKHYSLQAEKMLYRVMASKDSSISLVDSLEEFMDMVAEIEDKYSTPELFPRKMAFHKKAQKYAMTYLKTHFNIEENANETATTDTCTNQ